MIKFEKVSYKQLKTDYETLFGGEMDRSVYDDIKLPFRATTGSAGYDVCTLIDITLKPGESIKLPTGIRVCMDNSYAMLVMPKSGLGTKYRLQLDNTIGLIDSDYYYSDNEGHIFMKVTNDSRENKELVLKKGSAIMQFVFIKYGIVDDDNATEKRNGGFGSTAK